MLHTDDMKSDESRPQVRLVASTDSDFAWMLGEAPAGSDAALTLPPGGVHDAEILKSLRATASAMREAFGGGSWMIVSESQVVGLCGYKGPPTPRGAIEIGYGIAVGARGRGFASAAIAQFIELARADARLRALLVETHSHNTESIAVLKRNGFVKTGEQFSEEGQVLVWSLVLRG
jgi:RimJ/RimL family protein N-acetyltransferase